MKNYPPYFKPLFLLVFLFSVAFCFGQRQSKIYNNKGQLIADTAFKISKKQLKRFVLYEDTLIKQLTVHKAIAYPQIEWEAGISDTLLVISFKILNDSIKFIKVVKSSIEAYPKGPGFEKMLKIALRKVHLKQRIEAVPDTANYYMPFDWQILKGSGKEREGIYFKNGKITITAWDIPLVNPQTSEYTLTINDSGLYTDTTKCERVSVLVKTDTDKVDLGWENFIFGTNIIDYSIAGRVVDRKTGIGLRDVTIIIEGVEISKNNKVDSTWSIETDSVGHFYFAKRTKLQLKLTCINQGYKCLHITGLIMDTPYKKEILGIKLQPE